MSIKLTILKIQLESEQTKHLKELHNKIEQLQSKLKTTGQWIEEDLDSKANFDLDYIYRVNTTCALSLMTVSVQAGNIYFMHGGASYNTGCSNRRATSAGWVINRMMKFKI